MTTIETGGSLITAFSLAEKFHAGQNRKSAAETNGGSGVDETPVPYISHLLAVAALVLENGGSMAQAQAALLHDVLEDTPCTYPILVDAVGVEVADIVLDCTHKEFPDIVDKAEKSRARKASYLHNLLAPDHNMDAILVALADKTHNAEATLRDWQASGHDPQMFAKFHLGYEDQKKWYQDLLAAFKSLNVGAPQLMARFDHAVTTIFGSR